MSELSKRKLVVIFKAEQDNDEYAEALNEVGFQCVLIPVLAFVFQNLEEVAQVLKTPDNYSGIILTSPRAVCALEKCMPHVDELDCNLKLKWSKIPTFVVGETTAKLARSLSFNPIGENSGSSESLYPVVTSVIKSSGKPLFFPCGNLSRDNLVEKLSSSNISVKRLVVYRTEPHDDIKKNLESLRRKGEKIDYVVFFSPSGVKYTRDVLQEVNFAVHECKWIAIGPTTKDAMVNSGLPVTAIAVKPTPKSLAEVINSC